MSFNQLPNELKNIIQSYQLSPAQLYFKSTILPELNLLNKVLTKEQLNNKYEELRNNPKYNREYYDTIYMRVFNIEYTNNLEYYKLDNKRISTNTDNDFMDGYDGEEEYNENDYYNYQKYYILKKTKCEFNLIDFEIFNN